MVLAKYHRQNSLTVLQVGFDVTRRLWFPPCGFLFNRNMSSALLFKTITLTFYRQKLVAVCEGFGNLCLQLFQRSHSVQPEILISQKNFLGFRFFYVLRRQSIIYLPLVHSCIPVKARGAHSLRAFLISGKE